MRKSIIILQLTILLSFLSSFVFADLLLRDDFQDGKTWWSWERLGGGEYPAVYDGIVDLRINNASSAGPSDSAIWNGRLLYGECTVKIRAKAASPMQPGTIGWGLWNYNGNWANFPLDRSDIAWFMKQYDPFNPFRTWWGDVTRDSSTPTYNFQNLDFIDVNEWHIYTIERTDTFVKFYVDEHLIHTYTDDLPQGLLAFHLWVDNYNYPWDTSKPIDYRAFDQPNIIIADFIEIYENKPGFSVSPEGSLLLKEIPSELGNGKVNYLWKEYTFESPGGKNLILVTARAENYGELSDDDDIRIVIDDIDLGWDTSTSFNGSELNGQNRSLVFIDNGIPGERHLDIYGDITPLLYDVTVIGSENGDIILNEELNEQAPGGEDYLWKEYSFNSINDEEVTIFISASALENYGDDDDIRIVLDGEDFGWDTVNSFSGDTLYGESKALVIKRNMLSGNHTLQIYADVKPVLHNVIIYGSEELQTANMPPVLAPVGNKTVIEGELLEFTITATDPDGDNLTFSVSGLPEGASFDPETKLFSWTPESDQVGTHTGIVFNVTDDGVPPASDSETISITVNNKNQAPLMDPIGDRTITASETLSFSVTATDPDGDNLTYSAENLPEGSSIDPVTGIFTWTPTSDQAGTHSGIVFTVTDDGIPQESDSETISITVQNNMIEIIVDNSDQGFETVGTGWEQRTNPPWTLAYGDSFLYNMTGSGDKKAIYTFQVPDAGYYEVYGWWMTHQYCSTDTPYTVNFSDGQIIERVNQQINGGQWNLIATGYFEEGEHQVTISNDASGFVVMADAIKIVTAPPQ